MSLLIAIVTDFFIGNFLKVNDTTMLMMAIIFAGGLAGLKDQKERMSDERADIYRALGS